MSNLRSAIEEFRSVPNSELSISELATDLIEIEEAIRSLRVSQSDKATVLRERGGYAQLGYPSPASFLMDQARMSGGHARQIVSFADAAERAPDTYRAWADGRLSTDQASRLFELARKVPEHFPEAEDKLVEIVEPLTVSDCGRALEYWRQSVEGPGELSIDQQQLRRGLSASRTWNGMVRVDGWLTTPAGEAFLAFLDAYMPPPEDNDHRSPTQRRHDAFEDVIRAQLEHGTNPINGGEKPHVTVIGDLPALQGIAGGTTRRSMDRS